MIIKNHFHKKDFELGLVLKQKLAASRKWPIVYSNPIYICVEQQHGYNYYFIWFLFMYVAVKFHP